MVKLSPLPLWSAFRKHIDPYQFVCQFKGITLDPAIVLYLDIVFSLEKGTNFVQFAFLDYTSSFESFKTTISFPELISTSGLPVGNVFT